MKRETRKPGKQTVNMGVEKYKVSLSEDKGGMLYKRGDGQILHR